MPSPLPPERTVHWTKRVGEDEQPWETQGNTHSVLITWGQTRLISTRYLEDPSAAHALSITIMSSQTSESLVKRLAGPSTGKAGLAKDQTEINRIIAEASKGSRFYEVRLSHRSVDIRYLNS